MDFFNCILPPNGGFFGLTAKIVWKKYQERGCPERLLSLRAKRSEDPQSPENQWSVFHGMAGQARHDRFYDILLNSTKSSCARR